MLHAAYNFVSPFSLAEVMTYHSWILDTLRINTVQVDELKRRRYVGDFHGLLRSLGIDPVFHNVCIVINDYKGNNDYNGEDTIFTTSDPQWEQMISAHAVTVKT